MLFSDFFHLLAIAMSFKYIFFRDILRQLHLWALVLGICLISGCFGDPEGTIIEEPNLSNKQLLAGVVFISPESETQAAQISETRTLSETSISHRPIETATVKVTTAAGSVAFFQFDRDKGFYTSNVPILEGVEYVLDVDYQGKSLRGSCKVPQQVSYVDIVQVYTSGIEERDFREWSVKVNIQDIPEEENTYHLAFSVEIKIPLSLWANYLLLLSESTVYVDEDDILKYPDSVLTNRFPLTSWNDIDVLIKDQGREGQILREDIPIRGGNYFDDLRRVLEEIDGIHVDLDITILTSDYNYYRYYKSIARSSSGPSSEEEVEGEDTEFESEGSVGGFGEEVALFPKTLEGGVGVFAAYRVSTHRFDLRKLLLQED